MLSLPVLRRTWMAYSEPKPDVSPVSNPVWPLWFAAMSFLVTRAGRWSARARSDHRRDRRLVTGAERNARDRTREGDRRDLALALAGAFAFGCTILFSRTVARDHLAPSVALGHSLRCRRLHPPGRARARCAGRCCRRRANGSSRFALGLCVYAVESTFFYMGLERGTAAAVALDLLRVSRSRRARRDRHGRHPAAGPNVRCARARRSRGARSWRSAVARSRSARRVCCFVCGSIIMFSTYMLLSDRVLPRTDSLTAAAWTAIGASIGSCCCSAQCAASSTCRRAARSRCSSPTVSRRRPRSRCSSSCSTASGRPARVSAWRSKQSPGSCWPRSSSVSRCARSWRSAARGACGRGARRAGVARSGRGARAVVTAVNRRSPAVGSSHGARSG